MRCRRKTSGWRVMVFEHMEEKEAVKTAAIIEVNGYAFYMLLSKRPRTRVSRRYLKSSPMMRKGT